MPKSVALRKRRLRATLTTPPRLRLGRVETTTMSGVGRTAWSEGPPLASHATPHDEVARGSPPPRLLEHPTVSDPELNAKGWRTPLASSSRSRSPLAQPPAKGTAFARIGMPSAEGDPAHGNYLPCCSPAVGHPLRRSPLSRDEHCNRTARAFCNHLVSNACP